MKDNFDPLLFTDQNNEPIQLGDVVYVTKGKYKGNTLWIFLFCIPQHRFGFLSKQFYDETVSNNEEGLYGDLNRVPKPFMVDCPSLDFYWTPKSKMEIVKR